MPDPGESALIRQVSVNLDTGERLQHPDGREAKENHVHQGLALKVSGKVSELCLEIRPKAGSVDQIEIETSDGEVFHKETSFSQDLTTPVLWKHVKDNWHQRQAILQEAGLVLGRTLFPPQVAEFLRHRISARSEDRDPLLRIEIRLSSEWGDFPWEIIALEDVQHLAIHPAVTILRVFEHSGHQFLPPAKQVKIHLIGVSLTNPGSYPKLDTAEEIERIRRTIAGVSNHDMFSVEIDGMGKWEDLVNLYEGSFPGRSVPVGPPEVFHFAGHGLEGGRGLVFRGDKGEPRKVSAEQIVQLLLKGRRTRLAFLNACSSGSMGRGPFQPFGGLADQLIRFGVPMVVGLQSPITNDEAEILASFFYGALAQGDAVDCALSKARRRLYMDGIEGVGWAFLVLRTSAEPAPLCVPSTNKSRRGAQNHFLSFGHERQRQRLSRFLHRNNPLVIVVHGEARSGHRHVLTRLRIDLERAGNFLWKPVAELRLSKAGNPLLQRAQLVSAIARVFEIPDDGAESSLEEAIASAMVERTSGDRVLVVDLVEVLTLSTGQEADSLVTLISDLWGDLMGKAAAHRSYLPIFLLVSIAQPRWSMRTAEEARRVEQQRLRVERTLSTLAGRDLKGGASVEILAPLEPFDELYMAEFLEDTLNFDTERAQAVAENLVGFNDNETILEKLKQFLADLEES